MTPQLLLNNITCVSFFLLALISFFNPAKLNVVANKWFGLFLFSTGCMMLNSIIYQVGAEAGYTQLIAFNELSRFIIAPALYLSVLHFTSPDKSLKAKEYLHFIPFLLFFIYMVPVVFVKEYHVSGSFIHSSLFPGLMALFAKMQPLVYWGLAWYKLNQHQKNIRLINSATGEVNLNWLRYLLLGIAFMLIIWVVGFVLKTMWMPLYSSAAYLAGVLVIGYFMLAQKEVYPFEQTELEEIAQVIRQENTKPVKQRFSEEQSVRLKNHLTQLMTAEKVYLNNELSLPELAKEIAISTHDLSYLLNECFGASFFQFVNTYRVEEAKQLMLSEKYKHLNILGIAYNAGFNSKTTFNTAFKKHTGLSPSQFMQSAKAQPAQIIPASN
jgi:AraC-like DNA-binding protein